jgi:hypothetical protein
VAFGEYRGAAVPMMAGGARASCKLPDNTVSDWSGWSDWVGWSGSDVGSDSLVRWKSRESLFGSVTCLDTFDAPRG